MSAGKIALVYRKVEQMTVGDYWRRALLSIGFDITPVEPATLDQIPSDTDWIVRVDDGQYAADQLGKIKKIRQLPPAVYYAIDTQFPRSFRKNLDIAQNYDHIFCAQRDGVLKLKRKGVSANWIPLGCDPEFHKKVDVPKKYSVGFIGGDHLDGARKYILQELRERYPDSYIDQAPSEQMSEIYSTSKIGVNLSANKDVNMRFFEILSCGTFLLTDRIVGNGLEDLGFREGAHYEGYESFKEMFDKIDYFLAGEEERETIALHGYQFTVREHTYADRVRQALIELKI